jgi:hypothetical protein
MAGHRRVTGKPTRKARRAYHWAGRIAGAQDAESQFDAAADYLRARARRSGHAASLLNTATRALTAIAEGRQP